MLPCPNCNHNLTPLTINLPSSGKIQVDHCYHCNGVWFDHYEINRVPLKEAINLSKMSFRKEVDLSKGTNKCPRDNTQLKRFTGESVPQEIIVLICPTCRGNFISKTELGQLRKAQKAKIDYFKTWKIPLPAVSSAIIPILFLSLATSAIYITVKNVNQSQEARIKAEEIISVPSFIVSAKNSVLVNFTTSVAVTSSVVYQSELDKEPFTIPVSFDNQTNHTVLLQNLREKTNYTVKIHIEEDGKIISSPTYTFTTN